MSQKIIPKIKTDKFTAGQVWSALKKDKIGYNIAKMQSDRTKMIKYATRIRILQNDLGIKQEKFPELNLK